MQVDQAIVSSIDSKTEQKNELVSRSANIDDQLAGNLLRWSPFRQEIALGHAESINFFPTECGRLALSRSVIGGQESRRSGGRRTLTYIVVVTPPQLAGFGGNAVRLTRVLQSAGQLLLHTQGTPTLPLLEIPDRCFHEFRHSDSQDTIFEDSEKLVPHWKYTAKWSSLEGRIRLLTCSTFSKHCRRKIEVESVSRLD